MLQYTRRFETIPRIVHNPNRISSEIGLDNNPILTYCNWNYDKKYHLTSKKLKSILKRFDDSKIPFYIKIFNETPIPMTQYFIDNNNLTDNDLKAIWSKVSSIRGIILRVSFWENYNSLRTT